MTEAVVTLYDSIVNRNLLVRRITLTVNHIINEEESKGKEKPRQLSLFDDVEEIEMQKKKEEEELAKERKIQEAQIAINERFGNNAILKGIENSLAAEISPDAPLRRIPAPNKRKNAQKPIARPALISTNTGRNPNNSAQVPKNT